MLCFKIASKDHINTHAMYNQQSGWLKHNNKINSRNNVEMIR